MDGSRDCASNQFSILSQVGTYFFVFHLHIPCSTCNQDVWSFGVVIWELLTDGAEPFPDLSPEVCPWPFFSSSLAPDLRQLQMAASEVQNGRRLSIPTNAPEPLRELLGRCWATDCSLRPSFDEICSVIRNVLNHIGECSSSHIRAILI